MKSELRIFDNIRVMCHPIQHHTRIQSLMTLPSDPTPFLAQQPTVHFSTFQGTQTLTQSQPCKRAKNENA